MSKHFGDSRKEDSILTGRKSQFNYCQLEDLAFSL